MKLPHPSDPGGDKEGSLPRRLILDTLFKHKVSVTHQDGGEVLLENDEEFTIICLPETVGGLLIGALGRKFNIDTTEFYFGVENDNVVNRK